MKIIALEIENENVTAQDFQPHLEEEAMAVWQLQQAGIVREAYFRADRHSAVLILECESVPTAEEALSTLPLVKRGLIHFEIIPLAPYSGFSRLFGGRA